MCATPTAGEHVYFGPWHNDSAQNRQVFTMSFRWTIFGWLFFVLKWLSLLAMKTIKTWKLKKGMKCNGKLWIECVVTDTIDFGFCSWLLLRLKFQRNFDVFWRNCGFWGSFWIGIGHLRPFKCSVNSFVLGINQYLFKCQWKTPDTSIEHWVNISCHIGQLLRSFSPSRVLLYVYTCSLSG